MNTCVRAQLKAELSQGWVYLLLAGLGLSAAAASGGTGIAREWELEAAKGDIGVTHSLAGVHSWESRSWRERRGRRESPAQNTPVALCCSLTWNGASIY